MLGLKIEFLTDFGVTQTFDNEFQDFVFAIAQLIEIGHEYSAMTIVMKLGPRLWQQHRSHRAGF